MTSNRTVAIIPGRFQPFTLMHARMYWRARSLFDHVIIGVKDCSKRDENNPFKLHERIRIIDLVLGFKTNADIRIVNKSPYNIDEYADSTFPVTNDKVVFLVGSKDQDRFRPSNCGTEGKYLQYYSSTDDMNTFDQNAYVFFIDVMTHNSVNSATEIRNLYKNVDSRESFLCNMYRINDAINLREIFDKRLL